jgi:hypothetical protein
MKGVNCAVAMQSALRHRTNSADKMLGRISTPVAEYDLEAESHEQPMPPWNPLLAQQLRASGSPRVSLTMLPGTCRAMFAVFRIDHSVQVRCGIFDVEVLVLACPAFRCQHSATMDVFKITIREFMPSLGILVLLLVDPQLPFRISPEPMRCEELILCLRRRPMLAPRISFVEHKTPGDNEFLGKVECYPIQFHRHDALSYASSALFDFLHSR